MDEHAVELIHRLPPATVIATGALTNIALLLTRHPEDAALVTPQVVARLEALGPLGRTCAELMAFFGETYRTVFGFAAPPLHDPVAVARVIDPSLVRCVDAHVEVELTGTHTLGATVVDLDDYRGLAPNAKVAVGLDVDRFRDRVVAAIGRLG